jgi:hypothetical protein
LWKELQKYSLQSFRGLAFQMKPLVTQVKLVPTLKTNENLPYLLQSVLLLRTIKSNENTGKGTSKGGKGGKGGGKGSGKVGPKSQHYLPETIPSDWRQKMCSVCGHLRHQKNACYHNPVNASSKPKSFNALTSDALQSLKKTRLSHYESL